MAALGYQPDADLENTADSVFCSHGAGVVVPWDQVEQHMHLERMFSDQLQEPAVAPAPAAGAASRTAYRGTLEEDRELQAIYERTYGAVKRREFVPRTAKVQAEEHRPAKPAAAPLPEYLLVDGYNIIFAWDELKVLASESLAAARQSLADILSNYQGFRKCGVILVFDAYKVKGNPGAVERYKNIHIVYTKEAETADAYIEKATYSMQKRYRVRVATSDGMEQLIILGHGATRVPANAFLQEIQQTHAEIRQIVQQYRVRAQRGSTVGDLLSGKSGGER